MYFFSIDTKKPLEDSVAQQLETLGGKRLSGKLKSKYSLLYEESLSSDATVWRFTEKHPEWEKLSGVYEMKISPLGEEITSPIYIGDKYKPFSDLFCQLEKGGSSDDIYSALETFLTHIVLLASEKAFEWTMDEVGIFNMWYSNMCELSIIGGILRISISKGLQEELKDEIREHGHKIIREFKRTTESHHPGDYYIMDFSKPHETLLGMMSSIRV